MNILLNKYRPVFLDDFENAKSNTFLFIKHLMGGAGNSISTDPMLIAT